MKLLIDESLSARITARLQAAGHDAVHVGELELGGADDEQVIAAAAAEVRILFSADTDFGSLLALSHRRAPSVVVLRRAPHGLDSQAALLISALAELEGPLGEGAMTVQQIGQISQDTCGCRLDIDARPRPWRRQLGALAWAALEELALAARPSATSGNVGLVGPPLMGAGGAR